MFVVKTLKNLKYSLLPVTRKVRKHYIFLNKNNGSLIIYNK